VTESWNVTYIKGNDRSTEAFDKVIVAASLSLANLALPGSVNASIPLVDYADTVVTHFTTRSFLSASYFGTYPAPQTILTSATATKAGNKVSLPFFSLRLLDNSISESGATAPNNGQNLFKVVSSLPLSNETIASFLEHDVESSSDEPVITWIHREDLPRSVPRLDRTLKIQGEIEIAPGLFYAGNGAQVTDTIEFACRMGRNVGRLIIPSPVRNSPGNG